MNGFDKQQIIIKVYFVYDMELIGLINFKKEMGSNQSLRSWCFQKNQ